MSAMRTLTHASDDGGKPIDGCPLTRGEHDEIGRLIALAEARGSNARTHPRRVRDIKVEPMGHEVAVVTLFWDQYGSLGAAAGRRDPLADNRTEQYAMVHGRTARRVYPPVEGEVDDSIAPGETTP